MELRTSDPRYPRKARVMVSLKWVWGCARLGAKLRVADFARIVELEDTWADKALNAASDRDPWWEDG